MNPPIAQTLKLDARRLESEVFERYSRRALLKKEQEERSYKAWMSFGKPGRDPNTLASVLGKMSDAGNWKPHLMVAQLGEHWDAVVGKGIAQHSHVASYDRGVLTIRAESTVWATQLNYLVPQIKQTISERLEGLPLEKIVVTGPHSYDFRGRRLPRRS